MQKICKDTLIDQFSYTAERERVLKKYDTSQIRNVAIIGHGGTGKTMLTEAILFHAGATKRKGSISDGNTVSDYDPEEIKRGTSISTALTTCQWKDTKINLLDTPGFFDFVGEVVAALEVTEGAVSVLSATDSLPVGFSQPGNWRMRESLPAPFLLTKWIRKTLPLKEFTAS